MTVDAKPHGTAAFASDDWPNVAERLCPDQSLQAALWMFRDDDGRWCVRTDDGDIETSFLGRDQALAFARATGRALGDHYWLFLQRKDGRFARERFNTGGRLARSLHRRCVGLSHGARRGDASGKS